MNHIISIICGLIFGAIFCTFFGRKKVYLSQYPEWLYVKDHPIPEDLRDFLATDGEDVEKSCYELKYTKNGEPLMPYGRKKIIAWMPMPEAPKTKLRKINEIFGWGEK